jgi:hypothetical protein
VINARTKGQEVKEREKETERRVIDLHLYLLLCFLKETPLWIALRLRNVALVNLLIQHGADPTASDKNNE